MNITVLIPAYNPSGGLVDIVRQLAGSEVAAIIVVNDGSSPEQDPIFEAIAAIERVTLLRHAVNLGKGAAIKTGLNYAYCQNPDHLGVVTMDADGQHLVADTLAVGRVLAQHPDSLIMGVRSFGDDVPFRSKFGNFLTSGLFRLLMGQRLTDTQTGLRGIPRDLIPQLLRTDSSGYEFELDMLLACKYGGRSIIEQQIQTIYLDGNISSHFNPLVDSMKIYFVLFRFMLASSLTAAIDYTVFIATFAIGHSVLGSQVAARLLAMLFNYSAVKRLVFYSEQKHSRAFPKYAALVLISGTLSYTLISLLTRLFPINVLSAKVISELLIFLANFAIQRDFIFTRQPNQKATDWDRYYSRPYKAATVTRRITEGVLHRVIRDYAPKTDTLRIGEVGGANSCFFDGILAQFRPAQYHVIDNNELGLRKFQERLRNNATVFLYNENVLDLERNLSLDLAFSVGLIEHFTPDDTRKAIIAHFQLVRPGGVVVLSFPTPTLLYRATRGLFELAGLWIFHDERPLSRDEVADTLAECGTILYEQIIWPICLTQRIMVVQKANE